MNFKRLIISGLFIFHLQPAAAQLNDPLIENIIESIAATSETEDVDLSDLTDQLYYYQKHPMDLNKADADELKSLYILNELQINALLNHIQKFGPLLDVAELQAINLFDKAIIQKLKPFITVSQTRIFNTSFKQLVSKSENQLISRISTILQTSRGFKEGIYRGDRFKIYNRFQYSFTDKINFTFLAEKDAGESFTNSPMGFDFYSANLSIRNIRKIKQLVIGDYNLQFGQGLIMWTGYGIGKSALVNSITKLSGGVKPFRSSSENGYFRGIAGTVVLNKKINLTPFLSKRNLDANQIENDSTVMDQISSIQNTGYHRSINEIEDKHSLNEFLYGLNINYQPINRLRLSLIGYQLNYDKQLIKADYLYNKFNNLNSQKTLLSIAYSLSLTQFYFFGEEAKDLNGGTGFLNGLMMSLTPKATLTLAHRYYARNFNGLFSQALREASSNNNENGFYSGLSIIFNPKISLAGYADFFRFPWLRYRVDAPSSGHELLSLLSFTPTKKTKLELRYKTQEKEMDKANDESTITPLITTRTTNYRFSAIYAVNESISLSNRVDFVTYQAEQAKTEKGISMSLNLAYQALSKKINFETGYSLFHTDSYNTRIYAGEKDILYSYSWGMYQDKGSRFFINLKLSPLKSLSFWTRYSVYAYRNKDELGSGYDLIQGNKKSEVKAQIRLTF